MGERQERSGDAARMFAIVVWHLWLVMVWALPIVTAIVLVSAERWLIQVAAMLAMMPIIGIVVAVAVLVLAGNLPRRRLSRTGWTAAPAAAIPVLLLHWGFVIAGLLTYDSDPQRGGRPSFIEQMFGPSVAPWIAWVMFALAFVAWLGLFVTPTDADRMRGVGPLTIVTSAVAVVVVAAAVIAAPLITASADAHVYNAEVQLVDADGRTPADVSDLSSTAQAELVRAHFERTQQVSSSVRGLIDADGWLYRGNVDGGFAAVANERARPCNTDNFDCYHVTVSFRLAHRLGDAELLALEESLRAAGWDGRPDRQQDRWELTGVDAEGFTVRVGQYADDDGLRVTVTSPSWWGRGEDVIRSMNSTDPAPADGTVTWSATEWPAIDEK